MIILENDEFLITTKLSKRYDFCSYNDTFNIDELHYIDGHMVELMKKHNATLIFKSPLMIPNSHKFFRPWHNHIYNVMYDHGLKGNSYDVIFSIIAITTLIQYRGDTMYVALEPHEVIHLTGIENLKYLSIINRYIPNHTLHCNNIFIFKNKILLHTRIGIYEILDVVKWEKYFLTTNINDYVEQLSDLYLHRLSHITI